MVVLAVVVGLVVLTVLVSILNGWALSLLWAWFMVPALGAPKLSVAAAIGISLTINMLVRTSSSSDTSKDQSTGTAAAVAIATPLLALAVGWVIKSFM